MDKRQWLCVALFLSPQDRVALACSASDLHASIRPTLTLQHELLLKYERWRKKQLASGVDVVSEDKSQFPLVVFELDYEPIESTEPGKSLFRNKRGDVLVVPTSVVADETEGEEQSEFTHLAETGIDNTDFRNPADLLKRQKALLARLEERKAAEAQRKKQRILSYYKGSGRWGVILCHGGYFAVGVYDGAKCLFHQSDHRYVTRKKQGGRQVAKDKHSGTNIHSAGSSMRRAMERKHQEAIESIIIEHKRDLAQCDVIFLHAPGINRGFFVTEGAPLKDLEAKVKSVGMSAGKANFTEIQRIIQELSAVELRLCA